MRVRLFSNVRQVNPSPNIIKLSKYSLMQMERLFNEFIVIVTVNLNQKTIS